MAEAKKCDLCGIFYEPYKHTKKSVYFLDKKNNNIKYQIKIEISKLDGLGQTSDQVDLCEKCLNRELQDFCNDIQGLY